MGGIPFRRRINFSLYLDAVAPIIKQTIELNNHRILQYPGFLLLPLIGEELASPVELHLSHKVSQSTGSLYHLQS